MRTYFIAAHVHTCAVQDQVFFLDLKRNRYLSKALCELSGISRFVQGWPLNADTSDIHVPGNGTQIESAVAELMANRLLSLERPGPVASTPAKCPPAQRSLLGHATTGYPQISGGQLLSFLKAAFIARGYLSVRSLYSTIRRIERRQARATSSRAQDPPSLQHLVEVFRRLRPLLPPSRAPCLMTSIALLEFLAAYRHFPRLVFGVQAHPFRAHCWLQHGDTVLNSTLEQVLGFTPIMVA